MQKLALFDLDDTLVDRTAAYRSWAADLIRRRGLDADAADWLLSVDLWRVPLWRHIPHVAEHLGLDDSAERFYDRFKDDYPRHNRCEPATIQGLERLRDNGWTVGIVTNGPERTQLPKIRGTGLDNAVDGWVISGVAGVDKPDPGVFAAAADLLGVDLRRGGWMVGDNPVADIGGGNGVGLTTVWMRHGRDLRPGDPRPAHTVDDIGAALRVLRVAG